MRKFYTFLLLITAAFGHAAEPPTVLVFGDSLSAGYGVDVDQTWVALLQSRLESQGYEHRVINASISGETTQGGMTRINPALENFDPDLVILELGGNDGLRGFPAEVIRENIRTMIESSRNYGATVVILGIKIPTNYGPRYRQAFENIYSDLATELDVFWIEFFMEGVALNKELMQDDGVHPTTGAQPMLLDNAWPVIREALTEHAGKQTSHN
jgi:acyl-CoA thioesterase-1